MEEINFINTHNLKQDYKLKKYVNLSIILTIATIITLTVITIKQKNRLDAIKYNIKKSTLPDTANSVPAIASTPNALTNTTNKIINTKTQNNLPGTQLEQNTELKSDKIELKKQFEIISNLKKTPKKETSILLNIYKAISKEVEPKSISVTKNEIVISAQTKDGQNEKTANKITKRITKLQYIKNANLASIHKNNNKFVFQIKGEIKL